MTKQVSDEHANYILTHHPDLHLTWEVNASEYIGLHLFIEHVRHQILIECQEFLAAGVVQS